MPSFLIKPSSIDFTRRRGLFIILIVVAASLGGLLAACRLRLSNGTVQTVVLILPCLLLACLLIWQAEHAARRRDTRETLRLFARLVGKLEQENATRSNTGLAVQNDETPGRSLSPPPVSSVSAGRRAYCLQDCVIPCSSCGDYLHCDASGLRDGEFKTEDEVDSKS